MARIYIITIWTFLLNKSCIWIEKLSVSHVQGLVNYTFRDQPMDFFLHPIEGKFLIAETLSNYSQWPIKSKTQRKTNPVIGLNHCWFQGAPRRGAVNLNEGRVETDGSLLYVRLACAQTFSQWEARLLSARETSEESDSSFPAAIRLSKCSSKVIGYAGFGEPGGKL